MAISFFAVVALLSFLGAKAQQTLPPCDVELLQFAMNMEFLEAEFFLFGAFGYGLDRVAPHLAMGGPPPMGGQRASLPFFVRDIITQFAYQEVGHLRAIQRVAGGLPRPLINLSARNFAQIMESAMGAPLNPPFNPYLNDVNFLLAVYFLPYIGLTGYVRDSSHLNATYSKRLVARLLAIESAQDAVIRSLLYQNSMRTVYPYRLSVAEVTTRLSILRNRLGGTSNIKDQGLFFRSRHINRSPMHGNIIAGDDDSLAFSRTPQEILRIIYGSGNEHIPGGFFPVGANGTLARSYLSGTNATSECSTPAAHRDTLTTVVLFNETVDTGSLP